MRMENRPETRWTTYPTLEQQPASDPIVGVPAAASPFGPPKRRLREKLGAGGAAIVALFAKLKAVLLLLPKLKLLTTSGSALVSIAAYSLLWGWRFAVGFVILLFVHEMGHVIQLRREGVKASAPMFIPFMGAVISARSLGDNALAEARVGLAGPILGSIGAGVVAIVGALTHSDLLLALAYFGFFLNLFNLLPMLPLDGGRAMAAMAPWMWIVGFACALALVFVVPNPILLFVLVIGGYETLRRWRQRKTRTLEVAAYYRVSKRNRLAVGAVYFGLIAVLALAMNATYLQRTIH